MKHRPATSVTLLFTALLTASTVFGPLLASQASASTLRERIAEHRTRQGLANQESWVQAAPGSELKRNVAYGPDAAQQMDVYLPAKAKGAPVLLMVHGGAWRLGDKANAESIENKVKRWLPKGVILVSINYRMLPAQGPLQQADDVALALAKVQQLAPGWGGDAARVVLMGHSAGAHLVSLLAAVPEIASKQGAQPWLGTVSLDTAAMDVPVVMQRRHPRLYDEAFGSAPQYWHATSPLQRLEKAGQPLLAVCSSQRQDSCAQANSFVAKASKLGMRSSSLPQDLNHMEINRNLGLPGAYTDAVETFLRSLGLPV